MWSDPEERDPANLTGRGARRNAEKTTISHAISGCIAGARPAVDYSNLAGSDARRAEPDHMLIRGWPMRDAHRGISIGSLDFRRDV
ncbi:hypothetical protein BGL_1c24220 [Burkholderia plantarii]|uniref:Uncharacterized protein n=1 Tax=Burkholderia plantarii TaxID=41899 RepID=A0A0B6RU72_BURPL|nr:hypothetical protein BGL_1c24220 [Burkholderia plantarii]